MSHTPNDINEIQANFDKVAEAAPSGEPQDNFIYSYDELFELKDVEVPFIITDLIPAHSCIVLFGEDGIGKTMLMTQLCMHIALKYKSFLNLPLNLKHYRAMVVATETAKTKFIRAAAKQHQNLAPNIKAKDVGLDFMEGYGVDDLAGLRKELKKKLEKLKYDIIVIDVLGDLFVMNDGDMNNATHTREIIRVFQNMCEEYETTIILVHHAGKGKLAEKRKEGKIFLSKDDQIGSGAITGKPRAALALSNNPKSSRQTGAFHTYDNFLHVVKMNEGGRTYVQNAIRCNFDTSTLLHSYKELVDITAFEEALKTGTEAGALPFGDEGKIIQFSYEEQRANILSVYKNDTTISRADLIIRMKEVYGVGNNRIEQQGGLLADCVQLGLIKKSKGGYTLTVVIDESDGSQQQSLNLTPPDEGADDVPF